MEVNTTSEGSQYEVWNVALDSFCFGQVLPVVRGQRNRRFGRRHLLHGSVRQDIGWSQLATTISKADNDYRVTFTDALEGGGLEHPLETGRLREQVQQREGDADSYCCANCTKIRDRAGGTPVRHVRYRDERQSERIHHDAPRRHLSTFRTLFASRADVFGRPSVTRPKWTRGYTWSITFKDYAGPVPLLQSVGGTTDTYGDASVSYTRSAGSGSDCCLAGNVSLLLSDGVNERWLHDVPSSVSESDLQDRVDVAFGAAEYMNSTFRKARDPTS